MRQKPAEAEAPAKKGARPVEIESEEERDLRLSVEAILKRHSDRPVEPEEPPLFTTVS